MRIVKDMAYCSARSEIKLMDWLLKEAIKKGEEVEDEQVLKDLDLYQNFLNSPPENESEAWEQLKSNGLVTKDLYLTYE